MEVDFANAVQQYVPNDNEQIFTFSDTDAAVEVKTTADSMKSALKGATLAVAKKGDDENTDIQSVLGEMYDSDPVFSVYSLGLTKDSESVAITGNTQITVSLPADNATEVAVYQVSNGTTLKRINATISDRKATFVAPRFGTFVVLDITDNYESIKVQYPDNDKTNAYFSFNSSTRYRPNRVNAYADYSVVQPIEGSNAIGRTFVIGMTNGAGKYATYITGRHNKCKYKEGIPVAELSLTVKNCTEGQNAYFVTKTDGSKYGVDTPILTVEKLFSSIDDNGNLTTTIFSAQSKTSQTTAANKKLAAMANKLAGENVAGSSYDGQEGYILITDKTIVNMPVPATKKSYYYDSLNQGPYYSSNKYSEGNDDVTLTYSFSVEDGAKNVGDYTTTATLKDSTAYWADGTNTPKVMNWSIKQSHYSIEYNKTVKQGDTIDQVAGYYDENKKSSLWTGKLKQLGFVNDDGEVGDNLPYITSIDGLDNTETATKVGKYTVHLSRKETATIHTNSNFIVDETGTGTLTVLPEEAVIGNDYMVDIPVGETLNYTGSTLSGVAEGEGYTLTKKATDGGYQNLPEKTAGVERYEGFVKYIESLDYYFTPTIEAYKKYYTSDSWKDEYEGDQSEYGLYMNEMMDISATEPGTYTVIATPNKTVLNDGYYWWTDGTKEPKEITWTIEKKQNGGGSGSADKVYENATVNLYVAGSDNKVLGFNAYLTNGNNPLGEGGYDKKAPTEPVSGNVDITVKNGKAYMTLEVPNPVFTLQDIGTTSKDGKARITKKIRNSETYKNAAGDTRKGRITKLEIELDDISGTHEYVFNNCEEFPTLLTTAWNVPLRLHVKFDGGNSGLDSNKDADISGVTGGGGGSSNEATADITVKVSGDTADVSKINTKDVSEKKDLVLNVTDGAKDVTGAKLPVSDLKTIADAKVPNTTVKLSDASVSLDLNALKAALKAAKGSTLDIRTLTGSAAEKKLSDAQKSALGDAKNGATVYVELSSNGKAITDLATGKLTVTAPYKWDGKGSVQAWQMDENGKLTSVPVSCKDNVATLTLTAPGAILLGTTDAQAETPAETKTFADVPANAYYKKAVDWAVENGITSGTSETTFAPDATCTRAQTVTFLWRAAGSPEPTKQDNPFTDVKADAYYYKAVLWAVEKGITSGVTATTFAPDATVSRAQVVSFQYRLAGAPKAEGTNVFTDVPANAYYRDAVLWAAQNGITSGTTATTFAPNAGCTRSQIVTFLYRQLAK